MLALAGGVYRSAEFCGTDHRFVVATLQVHFKPPPLLQCGHSRVFHLDWLGDEECARRFTVAITDWLTVLKYLTDPRALWKSIDERPETR